MKYVWHALAVLLLFAGILAAPALYEELTRKDPFAPAETVTPAAGDKAEAEKPVMRDMPPQPQRDDAQESGRLSVRGSDANDIIKSPAAPPAMDGGGGRDTIVLGNGGEIRIDGAHITGMEVFDIANGQRNAVTVLSEGLHGADHNSIVIKGDADLDTVHLDSTMNWTGPEADTELFYYTGTDVQGEKYSVAVMRGVKVDYNGR